MNQMFSDEITDEVLRRAIQNNIQEVNLASKQAVKKVNYMQKIENIHLLTTGGIAHEFNNILSCWPIRLPKYSAVKSASSNVVIHPRNDLLLFILVTLEP